MISDRLQRDDIAGFLALMDPKDNKHRATEILMMENRRAIIKRIAGGQGFYFQ